MKRETFEEYLGDVDTELLLQNLTNTNGTARANIDCVREMFPHGFEVSGYFETSVLETETERNERLESMERRLSKATNPSEQFAALVPADKMLVRLILQPKKTP
jgi:hypothetical protein